MSQAYDIFMNSYMKSLKRPEFFDFKPDQAFGANMVHGSENQNPWANRNTENAKYGMLGGTQPIKQVVAAPSNSVSNMPGFGAGPTASPAQGTFSNLMASVTPGVSTIGSNWMAGSGMDLIKKLFASEENPGVKESVSRAMEGMLGGETPMSGTERMVANFLNDTPVKSGVEQAVENLGTKAAEEGVKSGVTNAVPSGFDPTNMVAGMVDPLTSKITGSKTLGSGLGAAATTGMAAAQGFANPISDIAAIVSLIKFGSKLFG